MKEPGKSTDTGKSFDELYPEHAKLNGVKEQSQFIGSFLDWSEEQGYLFVERVEDIRSTEDEPVMIRVNKSIQQLLADYHGIDLQKLEQEKLKMLEECRKINKDL